MWRVTGKVNEDGSVTETRLNPENKGKEPILAMHGAGQNGFGWITEEFEGGERNPLLRLVDRGYDVWVGNSRGAKYSNEHVRDGEWSLKERWNFTWADMGVNDLPANIDLILDVSGAEKLTLLAMSQGSAQSWYGLAKRQGYFADRVRRFVAMASCI